MKIEKEFIPYEQALALKELGFDEDCLAYYTEKYTGGDKHPIAISQHEGSSITGDKNSDFRDIYFICTAPMWQQAFRWFREKYDLLGYVNDESSVEDNPNIHKKWMYVIQELPIVLHDDLSNGKIYKTYEEAELECLKKLIEIVKNDNRTN